MQYKRSINTLRKIKSEKFLSKLLVPNEMKNTDIVHKWTQLLTMHREIVIQFIFNHETNLMHHKHIYDYIRIPLRLLSLIETKANTAHKTLIIKNVHQFANTRCGIAIKNKRIKIGLFDFILHLYPNGLTQIHNHFVGYFVEITDIPINVQSVVICIALYCTETDTKHQKTVTLYEIGDSQGWIWSLSSQECKLYSNLSFGAHLEILQIVYKSRRNKERENYVQTDINSMKGIQHKYEWKWNDFKPILNKINNCKHKQKLSFLSEKTDDDMFCFGIEYNENDHNLWFVCSLLKLPAFMDGITILFKVSLGHPQYRNTFNLDYKESECKIKLIQDDIEWLLMPNHDINIEICIEIIDEISNYTKYKTCWIQMNDCLTKYYTYNNKQIKNVFLDFVELMGFNQRLISQIVSEQEQDIKHWKWQLLTYFEKDIDLFPIPQGIQFENVIQKQAFIAFLFEYFYCYNDVPDTDAMVNAVRLIKDDRTVFDEIVEKEIGLDETNDILNAKENKNKEKRIKIEKERGILNEEMYKIRQMMQDIQRKKRKLDKKEGELETKEKGIKRERKELMVQQYECKENKENMMKQRKDNVLSVCARIKHQNELKLKIKDELQAVMDEIQWIPYEDEIVHRNMKTDNADIDIDDEIANDRKNMNDLMEKMNKIAADVFTDIDASHLDEYNQDIDINSISNCTQSSCALIPSIGSDDDTAISPLNFPVSENEENTENKTSECGVVEEESIDDEDRNGNHSQTMGASLSIESVLDSHTQEKMEYKGTKPTPNGNVNNIEDTKISVMNHMNVVSEGNDENNNDDVSNTTIVNALCEDNNTKETRRVFDTQQLCDNNNMTIQDTMECKEIAQTQNENENIEPHTIKRVHVDHKDNKDTQTLNTVPSCIVPNTINLDDVTITECKETELRIQTLDNAYMQNIRDGASNSSKKQSISSSPVLVDLVTKPLSNTCVKILNIIKDTYATIPIQFLNLFLALYFTIVIIVMFCTYYMMLFSTLYPSITSFFIIFMIGLLHAWFFNIYFVDDIQEQYDEVWNEEANIISMNANTYLIKTLIDNQYKISITQCKIDIKICEKHVSKLGQTLQENVYAHYLKLLSTQKPLSDSIINEELGFLKTLDTCHQLDKTISRLNPLCIIRYIHVLREMLNDFSQLLQQRWIYIQSIQQIAKEWKQQQIHMNHNVILQHKELMLFIPRIEHLTQNTMDHCQRLKKKYDKIKEKEHMDIDVKAFRDSLIKMKQHSFEQIAKLVNKCKYKLLKIINGWQVYQHMMRMYDTCTDECIEEGTTEDVILIDKANDNDTFMDTIAGKRYKKMKKDIGEFGFKIYLYPNGYNKNDIGFVQFGITLYKQARDVQSVVVFVKLYEKMTHTEYQCSLVFDACGVHNMRWYPHLLSLQKCRHMYRIHKQLEFGYHLRILQIRRKNGVVTDHETIKKELLSQQNNIVMTWFWDMERHIITCISDNIGRNLMLFYHQHCIHKEICVSLGSALNKRQINISLNIFKLPPKIEKLKVLFEVRTNCKEFLMIKRKEHTFSYDCNECIIELNKKQSEKLLGVARKSYSNNHRKFVLNFSLKIKKIYFRGYIDNPYILPSVERDKIKQKSKNVKGNGNNKQRKRNMKRMKGKLKQSKQNGE